MNNKVVSGMIAAVALTSGLSIVAPAHAVSLGGQETSKVSRIMELAAQAEQAGDKYSASKEKYDALKKANDEALKITEVTTFLKAKTDLSTKEQALAKAKLDEETAIKNKSSAATIKKKTDARKNAEINYNISLNSFKDASAKVKPYQTNLNDIDKYSEFKNVPTALNKEYTDATNKAWGNWDKKSEIQDKSTDKSGFQSLINELQQKFVQKERFELKDPGAQKLDLNLLKLKGDHDVRVWFLNEGAGFRNQLAYEASYKSNYEKGLIFDDVSCYTANGANKACQLGNLDKGVLDIGDYANLGEFKRGSSFNFLLKGNGANNSFGHIYGANAAENPDGLDHLVAYMYKGYMVMGFEDLFGAKGATGGKNQSSDRDFNDTVFVVDFGKDNTVSSAKDIPEPSGTVALLGITGASLMLRRRKKFI